jgi:diaminopimelate epimerase
MERPAGRGRPFVKMSGSGNDFVFFDTRGQAAGDLDTPARIQAICARGTGVGADGIVFVEPLRDPSAHRSAGARIRYVNADGSPAGLCGNATLCAVRYLSEELGADRELSIETEVGLVTGRLRDGVPEIDLAPAGSVTPDMTMDLALVPGERALGFALVGVPHLVVLVDDVETVDLAGRGAELRRHPALGRSGANVNFVARSNGGWVMRTFERGVEGETLACGTGAVASANLVAAWNPAEGDAAVALQTRSGSVLRVRLVGGEAGLAPRPSLSGEGRIVFWGHLP